MSKKISLISLGCPKNQVDGEMLLANLKENGFEILENVDGSDVPQTANDGSANEGPVASETPEDASQVEQIPDQEDQSPTM